ncbi:uncharacterized protein LOC119991413 [Tripterygium wilfordii]|uniref:uncharacterized protein LOC119991413 n=1 Tax=Tripterygium wilfordii TaxID=458696 RepID=UPI0018F85DA7|nr:uncharacterized protein LOC119991413 [Tripterygium wilfordii]
MRSGEEAYGSEDEASGGGEVKILIVDPSCNMSVGFTIQSLLPGTNRNGKAYRGGSFDFSKWIFGLKIYDGVVDVVKVSSFSGLKESNHVANNPSIELGQRNADNVLDANYERSAMALTNMILCLNDRMLWHLHLVNQGLQNLSKKRSETFCFYVVFDHFVDTVCQSTALYVNTEDNASTLSEKKIYIHPPSAQRILLPDGRHVAYKEHGVPADRARFSMIVPHTFLSSRLAGIPGIKDSLLEEFGVRLLAYDLPGFGESDPHPSRNLESSALDMSFMANALGVGNKFWVVGYSSSSLHAWAALRYIPDRLAGAAMFAPMVNPYDPLMTKGEKHGTWEKWTHRRKFMYFLARRFPRLLAYFYRRSFLSGKHGQIDRWLSLSLGKRDKALIEDPIYEEFWQRDLEESIPQGNTKAFVEEAALMVSNWGFSLADLKLQKKKQDIGILRWLNYLLRAQEEYTGFFGPIHIWQGMEDMVVPPSMTDFVHRILPGAAVHKLPYEGHFTYIYFCDECHRQILTTLFGTPQGPLSNTIEIEKPQHEGNTEEREVETSKSES